MTVMRVAVLGAGRWSAAVHLPALRDDPNVEIVGVVDRDPVRARHVAELFGIPAAEEVDALGPIDGAIVATSHDSHAELALPLLTAGIDVMVEKPLTLDPVSAWGLVEAAAAHGARLHTGFTFLHARPVEQLRVAIGDGRLGRIRLVSGDFASGAGRLFGGQTEPVAGEPVAPLAASYADPARGGGQLHAQATHAVSLVLHASGLSATDVSARFVQPDGGVDIADALTVGFDGAVAALSSTGTVLVRAQRVEHYRFFGDEGHAELDTVTGRLEFVDYATGVREVNDVRDPQAANPVTAPARELVDAWRHRRAARVDGVIGAQTVEVLYAAEQSARSGRRETIARWAEGKGE